jgi:hypothetical protein
MARSSSSPKTAQSSTKGIVWHRAAGPSGPQPRRHDECYMASIFGTLLSSQGSGAHRIRLLSRSVGATILTYRIRIEAVNFVSGVPETVVTRPAVGIRFLDSSRPCGPVVLRPGARTTPGHEVRHCESKVFPWDRPPRGVRSSLSGRHPEQ